jgi:hypothetical protein
VFGFGIGFGPHLSGSEHVEEAVAALLGREERWRGEVRTHEHEHVVRQSLVDQANAFGRAACVRPAARQ